MKKFIILLVLWILCSDSFSQQMPHFSQYMLNGYLINPAIAGSENYADVKVGYRKHWAGFTGAPESAYFTVHAPLKKLNLNSTANSFPLRERNGNKILDKNYNDGTGKNLPHHGVGLAVISDKAGALQRTDISPTYAYHLPLTNRLKMSAGISAGFSFFNVDQDKLYLTDPDDPAFLAYNHVNFNLSTGFILYSRRFYLGATAAQLFQDEVSGGWSQQDRTYTQLYFTGGYKILLSRKFSVLPSVLVKYLRPVAVSTDINIKLLYSNRIWFGTSYRNQDAIVWMGGINFNNLLQLSYAYDMANSEIGKLSNGSHEIVLGLLLGNKGKVFSPSDFW